MGGECKVYQNISNPATYAQVLIAEPLNEVHGSKRWSKGVSNTLNLISQRPSNHHVCVCVCVFSSGVRVRRLLGWCRRLRKPPELNVWCEEADVWQRTSAGKVSTFPPEHFQSCDFKNPPRIPLVCVTQVYHRCSFAFGWRNSLSDLRRSVQINPNSGNVGWLVQVEKFQQCQKKR